MSLRRRQNYQILVKLDSKWVLSFHLKTQLIKNVISKTRLSSWSFTTGESKNTYSKRRWIIIMWTDIISENKISAEGGETREFEHGQVFRLLRAFTEQRGRLNEQGRVSVYLISRSHDEPWDRKQGVFELWGVFEIRRTYSVALLLSKKKLVRDDFILYRQNILYPTMYHIMLQQRFSFAKGIFIFFWRNVYTPSEMSIVNFFKENFFFLSSFLKKLWGISFEHCALFMVLSWFFESLE